MSYPNPASARAPPPPPQPQPQPQPVAAVAAAENVLQEQRAVAAAAELRRLDAAFREASREWGEKLRAAQSASAGMQAEVDALRRTASEQAETIARLREQAAASTRARSSADKLRAENAQFRDRVRDAEARLQESEALRLAAQRRLDERERAAAARTTDAAGLRGQLHSRDELVGSLSDTLRARDAALSKLSIDYQAAVNDSGRERHEHALAVGRLETLVLEAKEREHHLRQLASTAQRDADDMRRERDEWHYAANVARAHGATVAQCGLDVLVRLEEQQRAQLEGLLAFVAADHCAKFEAAMRDRTRESSTARKTVAHVLDDAESMARELGVAQQAARAAVADRDSTYADCGVVSELATEALRSFELLVSSASWRRAVIEALVPEEICAVVLEIKRAVAEVVHRAGAVAQRAGRRRTSALA